MSDLSSKRSSPLLLTSLLIAGVIALVILARSFTHEKVDVRVSPATHENLLSSVSTNGKVEPIDEFQAHAPGPGVVQKIYVEVGQKVKQGDLLVRLDDSEALARLASANATLKSAQATAGDLQQGGTQEERIANSGELARAQQAQAQAQASLASLKQLQLRGAASAGEVTAAQDRLDSATNALKTAQQRSTDRYSASDKSRSAAQVADANAAYLAAQAAYQKAVIRAPISGTVYSITVNQYDFVPGGEDLLDMADLNRIHVRAYFDEPEIGKLAAGQAVRIVWDARPNRIWHGHVEIAPTTVITYGTRNVGEAIITVDDAQGDLLPNTNVTVTVTTSQRFNVLSIPREALHTEGTVNFVYRVVSNRLQRTVVQVGAVNLTRVEVTGGLTEKDVVALNATSNRDLANGLLVHTVE